MSELRRRNLFVLRSLIRASMMEDMEQYNQAVDAATNIDSAWDLAHGHDVFFGEDLDTVKQLHEKIAQLQQQYWSMGGAEAESKLHQTVLTKLYHQFPTARALQTVATHCRNLGDDRRKHERKSQQEPSLVFLCITDDAMVHKLHDKSEYPEFFVGDANDVCITDCGHVWGATDMESWFKMRQEKFNCPICRHHNPKVYALSCSASRKANEAAVAASMEQIEENFHKVAYLFDVMWLRAYVLVFEQMLAHAAAAAAAAAAAPELSAEDLRAARLEYFSNKKGGSHKKMKTNRRSKYMKSNKYRKSMKSMKSRKSRKH